MVAHGLALGLYSKKGAIERIENKKTWEALGYKVIEPANRETYNAGDTMEIERPEAFSRNKLETLLKEHKKEEQHLIQVKSFSTLEEEINFIVSKIQQAIETGKVDPTEIIVITLDTRTAKSDLLPIRQALDRLNIDSTMPGIVENASVFKLKGTITLTTPFRAKGNEGNIVFVMNAQKAVSDVLFRARNALFVAVTRARGWCYISGHSSAMNELENEIDAILRDYPRFKFQQPSDEEVKRKRIILSKQGDNEMQKKDEFLDNILQNDRELLIEKILQDKAILEAIKSNRG
jgi:superfamily I DNA and RNA helicase